jgi:hypothetical protein
MMNPLVDKYVAHYVPCGSVLRVGYAHLFSLGKLISMIRTGAIVLSQVCDP